MKKPKVPQRRPSYKQLLKECRFFGIIRKGDKPSYNKMKERISAYVEDQEYHFYGNDE